MDDQKIKLINKFYGGMTRDDKSKIPGTSYNIEELDIFTNADWFQAEQIFSSNSLPASTEAYAYTSDNDGVAYAYGKETAASKVRLLSVSGASGTNPSTFATLFTSADATNLAYVPSPIQYFKTTESPAHYLYYMTNASGTILLRRYNISGASEATVGTLDGLNGSFDRCGFKVIFGELFVMNGQYISKVDKDGVFTQHAFALPNEWRAVDIIAISDVAVILGRYIDKGVNFSKGFWWDLTSLTQVDDSFDIPCGGPQWIVNHKETVKMLCAINGQARFFQLSGPFAGAAVLELPGMSLTNIATETATQPISAPKMVGVKDKILYFGLYKTDKTGVYAIGQIDSDKPNALILSKRFATSSYASHAPTALLILGPNYFGSFSDNGTATAVICKTLNSPSRSSSGIYESVFIDDDNPLSSKKLDEVFVTTYPLSANTDINVYVAADYGNYSEILRADSTSMNTTSALIGKFLAKSFSGNKGYRVKLELVSSSSNSPKVTSIALRLSINKAPASK